MVVLGTLWNIDRLLQNIAKDKTNVRILYIRQGERCKPHQRANPATQKPNEEWKLISKVPIEKDLEMRKWILPVNHNSHLRALLSSGDWWQNL